MNKKTQFAAMELILLILLFAFSSSYYIKPIPSTNQNYKTSIDSALDAIYYNENHRGIIMSENLSLNYLSHDWSSLNSSLSQMFYDYEISVSNISLTKTITTCKTNYNDKHITQRIISIKNNETFEFRTISLGVCY